MAATVGAESGGEGERAISPRSAARALAMGALAPVVMTAAIGVLGSLVMAVVFRAARFQGRSLLELGEYVRPIQELAPALSTLFTFGAAILVTRRCRGAFAVHGLFAAVGAWASSLLLGAAFRGWPTSTRVLVMAAVLVAAAELGVLVSSGEIAREIALLRVVRAVQGAASLDAVLGAIARFQGSAGLERVALFERERLSAARLVLVREAETGAAP